MKKMWKYTRTRGENAKPRNEWRRCENTLEASGEDVKIHSKRVGKIELPFVKSGTCDGSGIFEAVGVSIVGRELGIWKLTVVLNYWTINETYSRIELLDYQWNLQSYWTIGPPMKLTVVFNLRRHIERRLDLYIFSHFNNKRVVYRAHDRSTWLDNLNWNTFHEVKPDGPIRL